MNLPFSVAEKLISLQNGEKIPFSKLRHATVDLMIDNGILGVQAHGRSKRQIYLPNKLALTAHLKNHYGIESLKNYVDLYNKQDLSRAEAVEISSNSKIKSIRTFKGFLINSYEPIECIFDKHPMTIHPNSGTFIFVYDYEKLTLPNDITVVGIENPENFRYIEKQRRLFEAINPIFVSRYPQSRDLIRWLEIISNPYLHFGDFDFAGLNIYWNEYKKHLKAKAQFFLPTNIEKLLSARGNRDNYNNQTIQFDKRTVEEENVLVLLGLIEKYKKGLEQEFFLN